MTFGRELRQFSHDKLSKPIVVLMVRPNSLMRRVEFAILIIHEKKINIGADIELLSSKLAQTDHTQRVLEMSAGLHAKVMVPDLHHRFDDGVSKTGEFSRNCSHSGLFENVTGANSEDFPPVESLESVHLFFEPGEEL